MLTDMVPADRLRLIKFVCSFAWADLEVRDEEKAFVRDLVVRLQLDPHEMAQVEQWLVVPPAPENVDPTEVPREHRQAFLDAIDGLIRSDGDIADEELESFALFRMLLED